MDTSNSNLAAILGPVIAAVNTYQGPLLSPNGQFGGLAIYIGEEEVRKLRAPPQVVWIPVEDALSLAREQPDDAHADYTSLTTLKVQTWGHDLDEAVRLRDTVITKALALYGPNAFRLVGKQKYTKGLSSADKGVCITFLVALSTPVIDEAFQSADIDTVNSLINITLGDGSADEPLPL